MKDNSVTPFLRIFKYVRPQWPRIVVIVFTAVLIGMLFSVSLMTVVPLLKVMMGEEGLHGWIDRKACNWRYGVDFYVPDTIDVISSHDIIYYLLIIDIEKDGLAARAGLKQDDRVIGIGNLLIDRDAEKIVSSRLLEELATTAGGDKITVQIRRFNNEKGAFENRQLQLKTAVKNRFAGSNYLKRAKWAVKWDIIERAQWAVGFMPRENSKVSTQRAVMFIILAMLVVTIVRCIATFYQKYMAEKVVQTAIARLREDVFTHVMYMPVGFFSSKGTSDTISRILGDVSGTGKGVKVLLGKALREPMKALFTLAGALILNYKLTLIFLCAAPPTVLLLGLLGKKIRKYTKRSLRSTAVMLGKMQGSIGGLRIVKVYNRQEQECSDYQGINRRLLRQTLRVAKVNSATGPIMEVLGMFAGSAALLVGIHWVTNANMQPSSFLVILLALGVVAESVRKSSDVWNKIQSANAASERVFAVVDEPAESEKPGAAELLPLKEEVEFRDVFFTYPGSDNPVLKGINLTVKAGQTIAIVGPNGSGKTTLVNLLPRFYDVDSGMVLIDSQDVREATLKSLRGQISMVTQKVVTFNDTIAANIGYGKADATREEIIEAAKRSFSHEFIEPLPEGYDAVIGEHGSGLSGGQLQRIVIARAIVKNPAILIFDEAMSQIDADSEAKIHKALSELMQDRTCFVIAHRFSTVISADTIVVMDDGQIVAQGSHYELIQDCPLYQSLYETQLITAESE